MKSLVQVAPYTKGVQFSLEGHTKGILFLSKNGIQNCKGLDLGAESIPV